MKINNLFIFFNKVQIKANELMLKKLKPLIDVLNIKNKFDSKNLKEIKKYCSMIPILGFNSSSYDINLMMDYGFMKNILNSLKKEVILSNGKKIKKQEPFILKNGKRYIKELVLINIYF